MEIEKQRGISVASGVMQMSYCSHVINLLDTPGHKDFSEDTARAHDRRLGLMVIDAANGVEAADAIRSESAASLDTPIITFVNKMDRGVRDPLISRRGGARNSACPAAP